MYSADRTRSFTGLRPLSRINYRSSLSASSLPSASPPYNLRTDMQSKRFLVTGGSQGIGAALVRLARAAGHQVVFTGRKEPLIAHVAAETGAHGVRADVSVAADNAKTVEA